LSGSTTDFSTAEIWVCDPYVGAWCWTFVEDGWHNGHRYMSSLTALAWFWADEWGGVEGPGCTGNGYAEHYPSGHPVALGQSHTAKIPYNGGNTYAWEVFIDGVAIAASTPCHSTFTNRMDTGSETTFDTLTCDG
jgi:hypothetical protein